MSDGMYEAAQAARESEVTEQLQIAILHYLEGKQDAVAEVLDAAAVRDAVHRKQPALKPHITAYLRDLKDSDTNTWLCLLYEVRDKQWLFERLKKHCPIKDFIIFVERTPDVMRFSGELELWAETQLALTRPPTESKEAVLILPSNIQARVIDLSGPF